MANLLPTWFPANVPEKKRGGERRGGEERRRGEGRRREGRGGENLCIKGSGDIHILTGALETVPTNLLLNE